MKIFNIVLTLLLFSFNLNVLSQETDTYQRIRIYAEAAELFQNQEAICFDQCCSSPGKDKKGNFIESDFSSTEFELIKLLPFEYEILFEDSNEFYQLQRTRANELSAVRSRAAAACSDNSNLNYPEPSNFAYGSMEGYLTYQETLDQMNNMASLFPSLINQPTPISDILTHEQRPIFHQVISSAVGTNKQQVLLTGIHHAREPLSLIQNIFFMWYLLENYGNDPFVTSLIDNFEIHFVPCVNPDGYLYNEGLFNYDSNGNPNFGFWRKNKRDNNGDGLFTQGFDGIDLNRNYGYEWAYDNLGSSASINSNIYRGPEPFSEPETQAMKYLCENNDFKVALNYHSRGNLLIYPWGFAPDTLTNDNDSFENLAALFIDENRYNAGTVDQTLGYIANGNSDDWMYGEQTTKNKIFAMTPEVGYSSMGFYPPMAIIPELMQATVWQNLAAIATAGSYGKITDVSTDFDFLEPTGTIDFQIEQFGLESSNFTLTFNSISPELSLSGTTTFVSNFLDQGMIDQTSLDYSIDINAAPGLELGIVVEINNGLYSYFDTIYKLNYSENFDYEFSDDFETSLGTDDYDFGSVISLTPWGISNKLSFKGNQSLSPSPNNEYSNNLSNQLMITEPIDLSQAQFAQLSFFLRGKTENFADYMQVIAILEDGTEVPLCGSLSNILPATNEPIYHGSHLTWEREIIDLSDFFCRTIQIKFQFQSDAMNRFEGLFLDNLDIRVLNHENDPVAFTGKIFLEGAYLPSENLMKTMLKDAGLLPATQPYNSQPYQYYGSEANLNLPTNAVEWILLEFRSGTPSLFSQSTNKVEQKAALLLSDGTIVAQDGISPVIFNNLIEGESYHMCVRHRNHLDVMSSAPITADQSVFYDFTIDLNQAFGLNQLKEIEPGVYALFGGDYNSDGVIQVTDYDQWRSNPAILNIYSNPDGNLDGTIQVTDYDLWDNNKAKIGIPEIRYY